MTLYSSLTRALLLLLLSDVLRGSPELQTEFAQVASIAFGNAQALAQTPNQAPAQATHWAYSIWLGSGTYATGGRDVFTLALPTKFRLPTRPDEALRYVIIGGATVGIEQLGLPGGALNIGSFRVNLGLLAAWRVQRDWEIHAFAEGGLGSSYVDHPKQEQAMLSLFGGGVRSIYEIPLEDLKLKWGHRILIATHHERVWSSDAFVELRTTLDLKLPFTFSLWNERFDMSLFSIYSISVAQFGEWIASRSTTETRANLSADSHIGPSITDITPTLNQFIQFGFHIGFANDSPVRLGIRYVLGNFYLNGVRLSLGAPI